MSKLIGIVVRDPVLRRNMTQLLDRTGARTLDSDSALDALNWLQDEHLDALVIDLHLEDMHGDDLVREIRQEPGGAALPVLMLIDHQDEWFVERAREAGAADALPYEQARDVPRRIAAMLRIDTRIETDGTVLYYLVEASTRTTFRGRVLDVSASGMAFQCETCELEGGFVVDTKVALPGLDPVMARAQVVRVAPPDAQGTYRVYLRWQGFRKGDRPRLIHWIRERAAGG